MGRLLEMYKHEVTFAEDGLQFLQIMEAELAGGGGDGGGGGGGSGDAAGAINAFGVATIAAKSQVAFRTYSNRDRFDVVLMDQYMPNMNGPTATRAIRERGYRGLIIGLTGDTLEEDSEYFRSHGLDAVLSKPLNIDELKAAIGEFYGSGGEFYLFLKRGTTLLERILSESWILPWLKLYPRQYNFYR